MEEVWVVLSQKIKVDFASIGKMFSVVVKLWWFGNVNAWLLIFEFLKSLMFCIIESFESGEEITLYLIMILNDHNSLTLEILDLMLDNLVVLHILDTDIIFDNSVDSFHIWETY